MGLERCGGLLRVMEIAHHHCGTGKADFAIRAVGHLILGAVLHNLIVCIRERDADGPLPGDVIRRQAGGGDALRQAIALPHLNGGVVVKEEFIEPLLQLHGKAVAAALEAAQIGVFHFRQPQQRLIERRYTGNEVAAVF